MRKNAPVLILTALGLAGFGLFAVNAFREGAHLGGGWSNLGPIWPYVAGGILVVAALAGGLMWLAFYSSRRGHDDGVFDPDRRDKPGG
jgi:hypothetical protein